ncbi:MAG: DUF3783 domain-containing protein [Lachnospiraceae bacterium]|nr:DUF3783 domain-containing protein [Lachnospiraceae bacterium]
MANQGTVLLYHIEDKEKERKLKVVLIRMGMKIKMIAKEDYMHPIGYLLNLDGFEPGAPYEGKDFEDEMMVMYGFDGRRLNMLLAEMRKAKISKINLKAMVTEHNRAWTSIALHEELTREHTAMTNGQNVEH